MSLRVEEYVRQNGAIPFKAWFDGLDVAAAAKLATALVRLSQGNTSSIKWFSGLGEYRIDWGPGYRIYLAKDGDTLIILFGGGTKKTQQRDIEQATALLAEYRQRRKELKQNDAAAGRRRRKGRQ
jgi:putative addiction module killer protein